MSDRAVRWLLRLCPATWRRRHGSELADILAARPLTPRIVADTILGAIDARWNGGRSAGDGRRGALLLWWVGLHLFLGALAFLGIRTAVGIPQELLATITTFLLLGSVGQWLILRRFFSGVGWWVSATMAGALCGLALVFCVQMLPSYRGDVKADILMLGSVTLCVSFGQWLVLRRNHPGTRWWLFAGALGGLAIIPAHAITQTMVRIIFLHLPADIPTNVRLLFQIRAPGFLLLQGPFIVAVYALATGVVLMRLYRPSSSECAIPGTVTS